jgi:V8-like Glu-specific endopeptidase
MRILSVGTVALALAGLSFSAHASLRGDPPSEQCDVPALSAGVSIEGHTPAAPPKAGLRDAMADLHQWLTLDAAALPKQGLPVVELSVEERLRIGEIQTTGLQPAERRVQVGVGKELQLRIDLTDAFGRASGAFAKGGLRGGSDGGFTWTTQVRSPGAHALRLMFSNLDLPDGAELYVYNKRGEAFGPYGGRGMSGSGELVSNSVTGDTALIQVHVAGALSKSDAEQLSFTLTEVGHIGPRFELARRINPELSQSKAFCSYNASCVINGECAGGWAPLGGVRDAIAHMLFRSGGGYYICSGGLVNNTANDGRNLFLTANHCLNRQRDADSLETFFNFRASGCNDTGACDDSYSQLRSSLPTTLGADVLAASSSSDYSLLELDQTPSGSGFAPHYMGYSSAAIANSNNAQLYRISHPSGAPQSWSTHLVDTGTGTCGTLPRGRFIYSSGGTGATEGGSSGSPVLNASGQVVGQLYGACGSNLNDECDNENNATVDGALANYFDDVQPYLAPGNGGGNTVAHVSNIVLSSAPSGRNKDVGIANVTVVDAGGAAIAGATVSGRFTFGHKNQNASGTTGGSGVATLQSGAQNSTSFTFCITDISGNGITYDSGANAESCDTH